MRSFYKYLAPVLAPLLALVMGALLFATIYYSLFDMEWIGFLAGVLSASVAAMASQVSKGLWLVAWRTRQLHVVKQTLAAESAQCKLAVEAQTAAEARMRLVADALPVMIVFVDRDERCSYHNRAFQQWCGRSKETINGLPLHAVVSEQIYRDLKSHCADVFAGKEIHYTARWVSQAGSPENLAVTLLPFPPDAAHTSGFYALIERADVTNAPARHDKATGNVAIVSQAGGETVYLQSMTEQLIGGDDPRGRLVQALQEDQFILFAQEIRPLSANVPHKRCLEVLLRLQAEEDNMLPPGGFFPVAEHYNLMGEIDRWVVHNLLKWCAAKQRGDERWRQPLYCVNLSPTTLCDAGFPRYLKRQLEYFVMPARNLCFEIAEFDLINNHAQVKLLMDAVKPLGCGFTVDGFGGTKVSFAPLKDLSFDFLKMDGAVTQNILSERSDFAKTRSIVLACEKIGVHTIAGFVESEEMLAMLREIGVDYAQGFSIGKPGPLAQVS
jgi:PAS domain S-box-containing protein